MAELLLQRIEVYPGFFDSSRTGFICEFERDKFTWSEGRGGYPVVSKAIVCPICLQVWARMPIISNSIFYSLEGISCINCGRSTWRNPVPGSLLDSTMTNDIDWSLIELLPEPLLRREFLLHLKVFA